MSVLKLTREQEFQIINFIKNKGLFLDNGGGRAVFEIDKSFLNILGLKNLTKNEYVVKIAFDNGIKQNQREIELYANYGDKYPLAEIAYGGDCVEIMEKVQVLDFRDYTGLTYDVFCEYVNEDYGDNGFCEDFLRQAYIAILDMEDLNGNTSDNGQIGMDEDGSVVVYDYGFDSGIDCSDQVSNDDLYVYEEKIDDLISQIEREI